MEKFKLEKDNNSKKLIIGISILFCAVILIIGGTYAFFNEGDSKELGNIVTTDIDGSLLYNDNYEENTLYNRQGLIPADLEVMLKTYKRTDGKKCLDQNDYSSCSVYRFSIKNNSNVSQELIMNLNPTANSYNNLKFILFEIKNNNPEQISTNPISLTKGNYDSIQLVDNFMLTSNEERMYELVFYVENQDYAQDDAGKEFGAGISINSVTTGFNVTKQYGTTCWNVDPKDSSKLISFNGINHDKSITSYKDSIVESCTGYVDADKDGYIVTIPSTFNNVEIKSIGNNLLNPVVIENGNIGANKYIDIKKIIIENGIERIDDGNNATMTGAFFAIGVDLFTQKPDDNKTLEVVFPNSLTYIGSSSFYVSAIREITIPVNVEEIGATAFMQSANLTTVNFETKLDDQGNKVSALHTIGLGAFYQCNLTYKHENPLFIPANVTTIEEPAFKENPLLEAVYYEGPVTESSWYTDNITTRYP